MSFAKIFLIIVITFLPSAWTYPQDLRPLSLPNVEDLLRVGVTPKRMITLIEQRGINFRVTEEVKKRFEKVGSDPTVIAALVRAGSKFAPKDETETRVEEERRRSWEAKRKEERPGPVADFVQLAELVNPGVVVITAFRVKSSADAPPSKPAKPEDSNEEFWKKFFGSSFPSPKHRSMGSGIILDHSGYILTSYQVIENSTEITITTANEIEYKARLVATDPQTDIALLKVDRWIRPAHLTLGDSDTLHVGEWVMAISGPFGLHRTVRAGIVSGKEWYVGEGPYAQLIQTDIPAKPGDAGGPLVNLKGEVAGINTSHGAKINGLGFATPINLVKELLPQLKEKGFFIRGWLGVLTHPVNSEIHTSLGLQKPGGALVLQTIKGGPAEKAGLEIGDVIMEFNGERVKDPQRLAPKVAMISPGKKVDVEVVRRGKTRRFLVEVGHSPGNVSSPKTGNMTY